MMGKLEILDWVKSLPDDAQIGVDQGGLILRVFREGHPTLPLVFGDDEPYLEIGGMPEGDDENENDTSSSGRAVDEEDKTI